MIVGLKWDAIDFENKKISIQHTVVTAKVNGTVTEIARDKTKTKSSCRTLPLIPACEQMLNKMKKEQEQNRKVCGKSYCTDYLDYIYVDPMGKRIRPDFLNQHFPDFLVAHQMKRIRFHDLRQSALCQWREPEGNSGVVGTQRYQHYKQHLYTSGFLQ